MFINTETLEYPVSEAQIRASYPNTSFPSVFTAPAPFKPVYGTAEPGYNPDTQRVEQSNPVRNGDRWEQSWNVIDLSEQEKQAKAQSKYDNASQQARSDRNALLTASDWTQVADAPVDKSVWATYRQALRDVPSQVGFPWDITWPSKPE